eukprot:g14704.t1
MFKPLAAEAYGRVAQNRYAENDFPAGAQLFKRFKMQLHNNPSQQNFDDLMDAVTKSMSRKAEMTLLDIFVLALDYIKNAALERMKVTQAVKAENVTWVLTVPVCCSEPAKFFMRQAAIKAGYIQGGSDDEALVLCMEPIAACLALGDRLTWTKNDKYLVVDCGGGTVDISAFVVVSADPANLDQVGKAIGGPWGSTNVDKQFEGYLKDFVESVAEDVSRRNLERFFVSSAMYRILQAWERAKVSLQSVNDECRVDLSELSREPLEVEMSSMDNGRRLKNRGGEELVGGDGTWDLVLRPALLRKFFKPHCDNIARAVSEQLDMPHLEGLTSVVMVGGFSGSVHVQEAVKACVLAKYPNNNVNVAVAASPDLAIVQGAAHYAHGGGVLFDPFFLRGEGYNMTHMVEKSYNVKSGESFVLAITSCDSPAVRLGSNKLDDLGDSEQIHTKEFPVASPPPVVNVDCSCFGRRSTTTQHAQVDRANIVVEFTLSGIELHVRVKTSQNQILLQQTVPFAGQ